jgi:hypothetical protein
MRASWFHGLDDQQVKDLKASYSGSLVMRKRLAKLMKEKVEESQKVARSKTGYDNPNWTYLQADQRGYERALFDVIEFILDADKEKEQK